MKICLTGLRCINIRDNGIDVPDHFDNYNTNTLGLQTVINIAQERLSDRIIFETKNGFECTVEFENNLYFKRVKKWRKLNC